MGDSVRERTLERDLTYVERGRIPGGTPMTSRARGAATHIAGGELAPGLRGLLGEVLVPASDVTKEPERSFGVLTTMVPETVPYMPALACRDARHRSLYEALLGPGGVIPFYREIDFESIKVNESYRVGFLSGTDEGWVRELFAPTFLDWLATRAPGDCYFELFGGMLSVASERLPSKEDGFDHLVEVGGHIAERLRSEALEHEGLAPPPLPPPPQGGAGTAVLGFLFKRSMKRAEEQAERFEEQLADYASERDLEIKDGRTFHHEHLRLPLIMGVQHSFSGELPGGRTGDLLITTSGSAPQQSYGYGACLPLASKRGRPTLRVHPRVDGDDSVFVGGLPVRDPQGLERPRGAPDPGRLARPKLAAAYLLGIEGGADKTTARLLERIEPFLLEQERAGKVILALTPETLLLAGGFIPGADWSAEALDRFSEDAAELAALIEG